MEFIKIKSKMFNNEVFKLTYFSFIIGITGLRNLIPYSLIPEWIIFTWGIYIACAYITSKKTLRIIEQALEAKDKENIGNE